MSQVKYMISDASKIMRVESHVLRYWEEELCLDIPRNEQGHRYYTEKEMKVLQGIKTLKEQGFQLKSIKMILPKIDEIEALDEEKRNRLCEELNESLMAADSVPQQKEEVALKKDTDEKLKMQQFQTIMNKLIANALKENNQELTETVTENIVKEMDYLMRMQEEREEEHYKKLDEALRERYPVNEEIAVTEMKKKKRKGLFWRK